MAEPVISEGQLAQFLANGTRRNGEDIANAWSSRSSRLMPARPDS